MFVCACVNGVIGIYHSSSIFVNRNDKDSMSWVCSKTPCSLCLDSAVSWCWWCQRCSKTWVSLTNDLDFYHWLYIYEFGYSSLFFFITIWWLDPEAVQDVAQSQADAQNMMNDMPTSLSQMFAKAQQQAQQHAQRWSQ